MYPYKGIHEWQTRLVRIKPNVDNTARLELSIIVVDLVDLSAGAVINHDTIVTYDALSYNWGDALPSIECDCDGTTILLRDNLAAALKYLRQARDERYVWNDFLCINQDDNTEKSFQIPRMRSIYSKASLVVIWLGESQGLEIISRHCQEQCGPSTDILVCQRHNKESWEHILNYAWFERTWVRQEVYAATKLDICSPYFSTSWEHFTKTLANMKGPGCTFNQKGLQNHDSLNASYNSLRAFRVKEPAVRLLELLKQGTGFQASVPHDHIFSILGMAPRPKGVTQLIPITYNKSYHEVCGDVTRFFIQEAGNINILRLCVLQKNRTYAFDWPAIKWGHLSEEFLFGNGAFSLFSESALLLTGNSSPSDKETMRWFGIENPIKEARSPMLSEYSNVASTPRKSVTARPLVLYGKLWGVLSLSREKGLLRNDAKVPVYMANDPMDQGPQSETDPGENFQENYNFLIAKRGMIRHQTRIGYKGYESKVEWQCHGIGRERDIFVCLEPGLQNVLLRRCPKPDELFEIVGWGETMFTNEPLSRLKCRPVGNPSEYYLASVRHTNREDCGRWELFNTDHPPGPRQRFNIQ